MARWPAPGRCKSRLARGLGISMATTIQKRLFEHTVQVGRRACTTLNAGLVLASSGLGQRAARRWSVHSNCDRVVLQGCGGLGLRLQRQVSRAFREGTRQLVIIGSDLPVLEEGDLHAAFAALSEVHLVLGPAEDGGYWLIGLNCPSPTLFSGVGWGGDGVLQTTISRAKHAGLRWQLLRSLADLDRPGDLDHWR